MPSTRRHLLIAIFFIANYLIFTAAIGIFASETAFAQSRRETALPISAHLHTEAQQAAQKVEPLVILLSLPGCPWCELLRRNYLSPMRSEGLQAYQWNVQDRQTRITDFSGASSFGAELAARYKYRTTPTVLFLDAQGQEIAPRIEGIASADLLGAVLEQHLATARQALKRR
jgi:thioredoxin-related protein